MNLRDPKPAVGFQGTPWVASKEGGPTGKLKRREVRWVWLAGMAATLLGIAGAQWAQSLAWVRFFDNLHWTAATSAAAVIAWLEVGIRGGHRAGRGLGWVAAGLSFYAVGQWAWDIQTYLGYAKFPAPSDSLYLWFGPLMTAGLVSLAIRSLPKKSTAFTLDILALAIAFCTLVVAMYLPRRGEASELVLLTLFAYPSTLFIAVAASLIVVPTLRLQLKLPELALVAGITGTAFSWMNWNYRALEGQATDGEWFNGFFSFSILLVAYGLKTWGQAANPSAAWDRRCEGFLRQLPLGVVLMAASAVIAASAIQQVSDDVQLVVNAGAAITILLAISRQSLLLQERDVLITTQLALGQSQKSLLDERLQLRALLNTIPDLVWLKDPNGVYINCNAAFEALYGTSEANIVGKTDYDFVPRDMADFFRDNDRKAVQVDEPSRNEEVLKFAANGYVGTFETIKTPMRDEQGNLVGVIGIARDITQSKAAAEALRAGEVRRKLATDSGRVAIWEVDLRTHLLMWDDNCFSLYQIRKEDFRGRYQDWAERVHPEDREAVTLAFQSAVNGTGDYDLTFRIVWPSGAVRHIEAHGDVIRNEEGGAVSVIGTNWDITEQKLNEEALLRSVAEKEALLKEVHHRVKNNLQVVTSMLRLEAGRSKVGDTKSVLSEMQARIRAMALLHETLYSSGSFASVDLGTYLRQLSVQAFKTQTTSNNAIQLELNLKSVQVSMEQAIPCGLLVNELISNCLKHGFPNGVTGSVNIELIPLDASNQWCIRVSDTGIGLPENFEDKRKDSLGLQLVANLARQIRGELVIQPHPEKGTAFTVNFQVKVPAPLVIPT